MNSQTPEISIVLPCYNEELNIGPIATRLVDVLYSLGIADYEIIFADDGSQDATAAEVRALAAADSRIRLVRLARNFGHQGALFAGLHASRGMAVITMDGDLQHPPALLPAMITKWRAGAQVVQMVRKTTPNEPQLKKLTSRLFYTFFERLSGVPLRAGQSDFRLLDREVVNQLTAMPEKVMFLRGLIPWLGFPQVEIGYDADARFAGKSKFSPGKMLRLAASGMTSFTVTPLQILAWAGLGASALSLCFAAYSVFTRLLNEEVVPGWASLTFLISALAALHFIFMAVLSQYVAVIVGELKGRPVFIVAEDSLGLLGTPPRRREPGGRLPETHVTN